MEPRTVRLGDVIDDYCTRCRLIMNHGVVGMVGDQVRKVRCNTCLSEHAYRNAQIPARRKRETGKLFEEVLRGMKGPGETVPAGDSPEPTVSAEPADESEEQAPPGNPPRAGQRRLYTIRRSLDNRDPDKGSKNS